jgi:hypothetical protein
MRKGAPGVHFYSLNKIEPVRTIWAYLRDHAQQVLPKRTATL